MKDVRKHVFLATVWEASIWLINFPQRGAALLRLAINPGSACPSSFQKNLCYNMLQSLTSRPRCFHLRADRMLPQREPGNFHSNVVSSLHVKLTTWFVTLATKLKFANSDAHCGVQGTVFVRTTESRSYRPRQKEIKTCLQTYFMFSERDVLI